MQKPFEILTSATNSQSTELHGTSRPLLRRTLMASGKNSLKMLKVSSICHNLKRYIGLYTLTFEEMSTLLCRIEACLNSRPIAPVFDNLDDYHVLSPGHFLVGTSLLNLLPNQAYLT